MVCLQENSGASLSCSTVFQIKHGIYLSPHLILWTSWTTAGHFKKLPLKIQYQFTFWNWIVGNVSKRFVFCAWHSGGSLEIQPLLESPAFSQHLFTICHCLLSVYMQANNIIITWAVRWTIRHLSWEGNDSPPFWSLILSLWAWPCPFARNEIWDGEDRKRRQGGWGEMPGLDITGHKSQSQGLCLQVKERTRENRRVWKRSSGGDKTNCIPDIKPSRAGMKRPSIIIINVSANPPPPPPLCRHQHHPPRHYPYRCDA